MRDFLILPGAILMLALLFLYIWSLIWVYHDAKIKNKPAGLVTLLVALLNWPISLLLWLVIRPEEGMSKTQ